MTVEQMAKSKMSNTLRWVKMFLPFVLIYVLWIICAAYTFPYITVRLPDQWHELAWITFVVFIPFLFLPIVIASVITNLGWTISSKKLWAKGKEFCVTRGPGKNVRKDVISGVKHPKEGTALPDMEVLDYGSVSQLGMEGPFDIIYPVGCISDDGMVVEIIGNPHRYDPERLPEPIRSRYIRDKIDPVTGDTITQILRKKKKVTLVLPALNPITGNIVGMGFDHALVETLQDTINDLREQLRRRSKGGETTIIREVEPTQQPMGANQYG
jgi:hypothetical protein